MNSNYAKACTQVLEIVKYFPKADYDKIPVEVIEKMKANMDKNYQFVINPRIDLDAQGLLSETKAIIISLFKNYYATEEQKEKISEILNLNYKMDEQCKCGVEELFNHNKEMEILKSTKKEANDGNNAVKEYKDNIFVKVRRLILKIFGKSIN